MVEKQTKDILPKGWMKPSILPYGTSILLIKKNTRELRMCIIFRLLNNSIKLDAFPLPRIADLLDKSGKTKCFSGLDLANAYY